MTLSRETPHTKTDHLWALELVPLSRRALSNYMILFQIPLYSVKILLKSTERARVDHFKKYKPLIKKVVAQLVERLLPMPEVHGLNPVISKH